MVADALSRSNSDSDFGINFMEQPLPQVMPRFLDDLCEVTRTRRSCLPTKSNVPCS